MHMDVADLLRCEFSKSLCPNDIVIGCQCKFLCKKHADMHATKRAASLEEPHVFSELLIEVLRMKGGNFSSVVSLITPFC